MSTTNTHKTMNSDQATITDIFCDNFIPSELWFDWFCREEQLPKKGERLLNKLTEIADSDKFDNDSTYVFFKNNCPLDGSLYDDFRICDVKTGEVIYTVIPSSGFKATKGKAIVWGRENDFQEPLVMGTWNKIVNWFYKK